MSTLQDNIKIMLYFGSENEQIEKWVFYEKYSKTFQEIRKQYYSTHHPMRDLSTLRLSDRIDRIEGFRLISAEERIYGLKCIMKLDNDNDVQKEIALSINQEKEQKITDLTEEKRTQYIAFQNICFLTPLLNKYGQERGHSEEWFLKYDFKDLSVNINVSEKLNELLQSNILTDDYFADEAHQFINDVTGKYEKYGQRRYRLNLNCIYHPYKLDDQGNPVLVYSDGIYYPDRV